MLKKKREERKEGGNVSDVVITRGLSAMIMVMERNSREDGRGGGGENVKRQSGEKIREGRRRKGRCKK